MRHQLRETNIRVVELVPPLVEGPTQAPQFKGKGIQADEFVKCAMEQLQRDVVEISYNADKILRGSRDDLDAMFCEWNRCSSDSAADESKSDGKTSGEKCSGDGSQKEEYAQQQGGVSIPIHKL